jgi:uncharacterized damage-inducible protein DinB
MDPLVSQSFQLYGITTPLIEKALRDFGDEEAKQRVEGNANCMLWLFAHLTSVRYALAAMLDVQKELAWQSHFRKGSPGDDFSSYPTLAEVRQAWQEITPLLVQALQTANDEQLSKPAPRDFPVPDKTIRGAILFLAFHESYHVGQMSFLRKCLGKDGLVG